MCDVVLIPLPPVWLCAIVHIWPLLCIDSSPCQTVCVTVALFNKPPSTTPTTPSVLCCCFLTWGHFPQHQWWWHWCPLWCHRGFTLSQLGKTRLGCRAVTQLLIHFVLITATSRRPWWLPAPDRQVSVIWGVGLPGTKLHPPSCWRL